MKDEYREGFIAGLSAALAVIEVSEHDCHGLCAGILRELRDGKLTRTAAPEQAASEETEMQARVLMALQDAWDEGEPWSKEPQATKRYAVRKMVAEFGVKGHIAEEWIAMWLDLGVIETRTRCKKRHLKGLVCTKDGAAVLASGGEKQAVRPGIFH